MMARHLESIVPEIGILVMIILLGHLVQFPLTRHDPSCVPVMNLSVCKVMKNWKILGLIAVHP